MDNGASSYRRYLDGDNDAFDRIIKDYWESLVFFLDRMLADTAASEDIAMDVFAELIANPRAYHFKASLKTYLFMLGRSRALNYIKRRKKLPMVELSEAGEIPSGAPLPEEQVIARQRSAAIASALAQLPEKIREAVYLTYYEGLSCEEAAKVMGKSRKQVYNLLYRGKKELRTILESEDAL